MLHLYGVDRDLQIVANVARTTPLDPSIIDLLSKQCC
jgi:hypothetical protein